ncbi:hypothetical protein ACLETS_11420 [Enterobacter ludwigii]|jgi:hypothetical protein|uniref:hypothetical protein n=1 Tax=Enterobacter ludwigii TaxID=299767 RepID=UPI0005CFE189|nr:hypothetical protein [Enterobacter ludwigii]KLP36237.1 hypothetical protein ABR36_16885 [Enterobacter ludwigii]MCR5990465.1 hypothetical protein [Enterobacter ludwigii]MRI51402.1 hypothetical protein [Enterobacter ludwigii]WRM02790.1 hypothetical protein Q5384_13130 [Enterobacter ludwigii]HDR2456254.1 hypothetical protein [Enterobacter ludwigii]
MAMTNRSKTVFRWGGIVIVSLCYFIALVLSTFSFSAFSESESMRLSGPIPLKEYHASIDSIIQATDDVVNVAFFGFMICVPLILIIFKKVR